MDKFNYHAEFHKINNRMVIYLQLVGYCSTLYKTDIGNSAELAAALLTDYLMTTDNPSYWLMVILCTRGMTVGEIMQSLSEQVTQT